MSDNTIVPRIHRRMSAYTFLSKVCEVILAEPLRYYQGDWVTVSGYFVDLPACGTVGCVAGWTVILVSSVKEALRLAPIERIGNIPIARKAQRVLGLTHNQAAELFSGNSINSWCYDHGMKRPDARTPEYAKIGVEIIRAFQAKYERQLRRKMVNVPKKKAS